MPYADTLEPQTIRKKSSPDKTRTEVTAPAGAPGVEEPAMTGETSYERLKNLATKDKEAVLSLAVSYYLSIEVNQKDIARNILGKSESLISRAAANARDRHWLRYDISGIPRDYVDILPAFLNNIKLVKKLLGRFPGLERCTVVPGPSYFHQVLTSENKEAASPPAGGMNPEQLVFAAATERLKALVQQHPKQIFVVGWGSTIHGVIETLYDLWPDADAHSSAFDSLIIYPFLGNFSLRRELSATADVSITPADQEKAFQLSIQCSANTNARELSRLLGQKIPPRPLLTIASLEVSPEALDCCVPVFRADQTLMDLYSEFWVPRNRQGKIWQADTLITSVGGNSRPETNIYRALGYNNETIDQCAADIGGILIDSQGEEVDLENRYLVGPRREHVEHIARRHREAGKKAVGAGVMVVASGQFKVKPLTLLARHNLINEIITDEQTALGMLGEQG